MAGRYVIVVDGDFDSIEDICDQADDFFGGGGCGSVLADVSAVVNAMPAVREIVDSAPWSED